MFLIVLSRVNTRTRFVSTQKFARFTRTRSKKIWEILEITQTRDLKLDHFPSRDSSKISKEQRHTNKLLHHKMLIFIHSLTKIASKNEVFQILNIWYC